MHDFHSTFTASLTEIVCSAVNTSKCRKKCLFGSCYKCRENCLFNSSYKCRKNCLFDSCYKCRKNSLFDSCYKCRENFLFDSCQNFRENYLTALQTIPFINLLNHLLVLLSIYFNSVLKMVQSPKAQWQ